MNYLSVCSGIEAATLAWRPLGWHAQAFAEIEPFPSAVLRHHYPDVNNLGDITKFQEWPDADFSLLVGGTPCQSFSVAGLRTGLDDPRGELMLVYLAIARRYRPRWVVWENVPGVLSADHGRAFGSLLGGLALLGYGFAYRILDAQYFGLAQRRRRVFVVAHLGDWRRSAAVLFERESLSGHPAPVRTTTEEVAGTIARSVGSTTDLDGTGAFIPVETMAIQGVGMRSTGPHMGGRGVGVNTPMYTLNATEQHAIAFANEQEPYLPDIVPQAMTAKWAKQSGGPAGDEVSNLVLFDRPLAFCESGDGDVYTSEKAYTLVAGGGKPGQGYPAIAFDARQKSLLQYGQKSGPLDTNGHSIAVAHGDGNTGHVLGRMQVRRLTPRECERLQGFPDDYTLIPFHGHPAKDGPRYKALGNSMAIPVMNWIGRRIQMVEDLT